MIREFELDAPEDEASIRAMFRDQTRYVTSLFSRCVEPIRETGKSWKLIVEVVPHASSDSKNVLGVLLVQITGDVSDFFDLDDHTKAERSLQYLMLGAQKLSKEKGWVLTPFIDASEKVRSLNFVNEWTWKKPIFNQEKTFSAEVFVQHKATYASISIRFRNKETLVFQTIELVRDRPNEFIFMSYLGELRWISSNSVELVSLDKEKRFIASFSAV